MTSIEVPATASTPAPALIPSTTGSHFNLRAPISTSPTTPFSDLRSPSLKWLTGTWHVTHSTLPMWKKSRNVRITYKPIGGEAEAQQGAAAPTTSRLDDLVEYQGLSGDKVKTVSGVDTAAGDGTWNWRGNGWLKIASSHWEVLGFGGEAQDSVDEEWVVTYFAKTLFTPAGIDVYSRKKEGLGKETLEGVLGALGRVDDEGVRRLAKEVFVVKSDHY